MTILANLHNFAFNKGAGLYNLQGFAYEELTLTRLIPIHCFSTP